MIYLLFSGLCCLFDFLINLNIYYTKIEIDIFYEADKDNKEQIQKFFIIVKTLTNNIDNL